jgi:hypothetical protein
MVTRDRTDLPVEIRIHGVRDHPDYSSLGGARPVDDDPSDTANDSSHRTRTLRAPALPDHELWLFNWSRTSRSIGGFFWYLALPFTLLNVVGQTGRVKRGTDPVIATAVFVQGIVLSGTVLLWSIAMVETVMGFIEISMSDEGRVAFGVVYACGSVLIVIAVPTLARGWKGLKGRAGARARLCALWTVHAVTVVGLGSWLLSVRPGQIVGWAVDSPWAGVQGWIIRELPFGSVVAPDPVSDPSSPCYLVDDVVACYRAQDVSNGGGLYIDVLSVSIWIGFVVSVALAVLVLLRAVSIRLARRSGEGRRTAASLAAGAFLLVAGWVMLVSFSSATRLGLYWALQTAVQFIPWRDVVTSYSPQPSFTVLPYQTDARDLSLVNGISLNGAVGVAAFALCLLVGGLLLRRPNRPGPGRLMRFIHNVITSLDRLLLPVVMSAGILWIGVSAFGVALNQSLHRRYEPGEQIPPPGPEVVFVSGLIQLFVGLATLVGFFALIFVVSRGRGGKLHETLDIVADVIAFWPPEWHALAGASYRDLVMHGLLATEKRASGRILLAGHSQGSVLAYWFVLHHARNPSRIDLLTCGSPIESLYSVAFPSFFDLSTHRDALTRVRSWSNVWRDTDPIATPLRPDEEEATPGVRNVQSPDPSAEGGPVLGHGDYWTDARQVELSERVLHS